MISTNQVATESIPSFIDFHLKNIVLTVSHILKDTKHFLQSLSQIGDIPENALFVLFDVVDLYLLITP